jgi:hypothetical protein
MKQHMPGRASWVTGLKWLAVALVTLATTAALMAGDAAAEREFNTACTGTYFIQEGNGSVNLWTFHRDGTLVNTSFGERRGNFSTQHGTWKAVGPLSARAIQLDFHWTPEGAFASIGRVDINIQGDNGACDTVAGEAVGRLFEAEESFLDPETDSGAPFTFTFTGFRVDVSP